MKTSPSNVPGKSICCCPYCMQTFLIPNAWTAYVCGNCLALNKLKESPCSTKKAV